MKFGDRVRVEIRDQRTGLVSEGYVIGVPQYSHGYDDVVVVAGDTFVGMPVHVRWCAPVGRGLGRALRLRDRFAARHPDFLARLTNGEDSGTSESSRRGE